MEFQNHEQTTDAVVKRLGADRMLGLSNAEVLKRTEEYGKNTFEKQKKVGLLTHILMQFKDITTVILLIAAGLSLALAIKNGHGVIEPIVILAIIALNITLAVTQERSAEKSLDALSSLSSPTSKVTRDGKAAEIKSEDLLPGDIVHLKAGDLISADGRLLKEDNLLVDESSLTGESMPVEKDSAAIFSGDIPLGDRINSVFSGCLVSAGTAVMLVTGIGMQTEIGKIAKFLTEKKKTKTPLQARLDKVGKTVSGLAVMSAILLLAVGLLQGNGFWDMALVAVTLAVAAVPETLSLIVTLVLTNGVKKMIAQNSLIRKLQAVETLGSTSVICSDKTGTLTMNQMAVKRLWLLDSGDPIANDTEFNEAYTLFLKRLMLASNASVGTDDNGKEKLIGDSTETAILRLFLEKGMDRPLLDAQYKKAGEVPFSSSRKMMTTVVACKEGGYFVFTKGAFDRIPFKKYPGTDYMEKLERVHNAFAADALRVITLAVKKIDTLPSEKELHKLESDLEFVGFIGIIDPPRAEAAAAIRKAKSAGIRTIMITGDHAATAGAIARELGIIAAREGIITGHELAKLSDEEFEKSIEFYSVYARVSPEDKMRIVGAWQKRGEVVSMTGDGVNDAPALKAADVGVAMGITGTEVSKSAADMILTDDKFTSIIKAVEEGRNVFSNIRKLIYFLLVCNLSEIFVMLIAQFLGWELPLTPIMLLLINVLGDGIPGMALAKEQSSDLIMQRKPIGRNESFFAGGLLEVIIRQTFLFTVISLSAFYIGANASFGGLTPSVGIARTMAFLVTGISSILHILTVRSRKNIIKYRVKDNPMLYINSAAMILLFAVLTVIPVVSGILGFESLSPVHWLITAGLILIPTVASEYFKFWDNYKLKTIEKNRVHIS